MVGATLKKTEKSQEVEAFLNIIQFFCDQSISRLSFQQKVLETAQPETLDPPYFKLYVSIVFKPFFLVVVGLLSLLLEVSLGIP